jgi:hypothetical protein
MNLEKLKIFSTNDCYGFEKLVEIFQFSRASKITYDSVGVTGTYPDCEYKREHLENLIDSISGIGPSKTINRNTKLFNLKVYKR